MENTVDSSLLGSSSSSCDASNLTILSSWQWGPSGTGDDLHELQGVGWDRSVLFQWWPNKTSLAARSGFESFKSIGLSECTLTHFSCTDFGAAFPWSLGPELLNRWMGVDMSCCKKCASFLMVYLDVVSTLSPSPSSWRWVVGILVWSLIIYSPQFFILRPFWSKISDQPPVLLHLQIANLPQRQWPHF